MTTHSKLAERYCKEIKEIVLIMRRNEKFSDVGLGQLRVKATQHKEDCERELAYLMEDRIALNKCYAVSDWHIGRITDLSNAIKIYKENL